MLIFYYSHKYIINLQFQISLNVITHNIFILNLSKPNFFWSKICTEIGLIFQESCYGCAPNSSSTFMFQTFSSNNTDLYRTVAVGIMSLLKRILIEICGFVVKRFLLCKHKQNLVDLSRHEHTQKISLSFLSLCCSAPAKLFSLEFLRGQRTKWNGRWNRKFLLWWKDTSHLLSGPQHNCPLFGRTELVGVYSLLHGGYDYKGNPTTGL